MSAAARKRSIRDGEDQRTTFPATWAAYEGVLSAKGDAGGPRISYLDGQMEVLVPGKAHEAGARLLARLLEVWADENEVLLDATGSWTLKKQAKLAGVEPDVSWVIGDRPDAPLPDLALEVVLSHGGLDKLEIYARLGVREVWFWIDERLSIHVLHAGRFVRAARSQLFRDLDLALVARFARHPSRARAPVLFREALRRR